MRNKLNYTEAVTVLIVILIGIIIGFSVYNNDETTVLKTLNDVTIEDKVIEDGDKAEITVDSKAINNENVEAESVNVKAKENSNEVIDEVTDLPFPQFDLFSIDSSGLATIAGKGLAGQDLEIVLDGQVIAAVIPDKNGEFAIILDLGISNKPRSLILRSRHRDGREAVSEEIVLITPILETDEQDKNIIVAEESSVVNLDKSTVDENNNEDEQEDATKINTVNKKETVQSNELDSSNVSVAIVSSKDLKVISPAVQKNAPRVSDVIIDAISYDTEGEVLLSGRGVEDQHIRIYVDNKPIKTRSIEADGTWSMDLQEIDAGVYILRIDQLDSDGVVTSRTETPFQKETSEIAKQMAALANSEVTDSAPRIGIGLSTVVIQPGYTLWAVARKTYGFGMQYVRIYHANKDQIRDPDLIYPGQIFKLPE
ncbi:MAG: LysM peptidoglycan-binding domain-containing protein [Paracoccaceae bacterium]|nr:LysM peptidoglycan-binding domain-containing protein [Paracoccaceae bacterium]